MPEQFSPVPEDEVKKNRGFEYNAPSVQRATQIILESEGQPVQEIARKVRWHIRGRAQEVAKEGEFPETYFARDDGSPELRPGFVVNLKDYPDPDKPIIIMTPLGIRQTRYQTTDTGTGGRLPSSKPGDIKRTTPEQAILHGEDALVALNQFLRLPKRK